MFIQYYEYVAEVDSFGIKKTIKAKTCQQLANELDIAYRTVRQLIFNPEVSMYQNKIKIVRAPYQKEIKV